MTLEEFILYIFANMIGTSIVLTGFYPFLRKDLGKDLGRNFAEGINETYQKQEENIKRKTF